MFLFDILEPRRLLSASATRYSDVLTQDAFADSQGFTPSQISVAYGFNNVVSANPSVKPDGSGQTIAIVDAFDDPRIEADLAEFDRRFSLPAPPEFKVVNQTGGTHLPAANAGWASEIALDVEWAHAMAPAANLLLVEARSGSKSDLTAAAHFAATVPGVSVVSISWGFNESASELKMDRALQTPAGHAGVTFVAAGGDNGMAQGAGWPAESPGVLSVGGTTLTLADNIGRYQSEVAWSDTGGGYSPFEQEPAYQYAAQQSGARSTPDVAYDGDPNTGFAVYDSIPYQGTQGWQVIAGNSAGAPQWAAIVAIADQMRAENGLPSLDGATQTLPLLYSVLTPTGASNTQYASTFHDINDVASSDGLATAGYDTATGLGTPQVPQVVSLLSSASVPSDAAVVEPIATVFDGTPPLILTPGRPAAVMLDLWDQNSAPVRGTVSIELYYSSQNLLDSSASPLTAQSKLTLRLASRQHKRIHLGFVTPKTLSPGHDLLLASITFSPASAGRPTSEIAFVGTTNPD